MTERELDFSMSQQTVADDAVRYAREHTTPPSPAVAALREETDASAPMPMMAGGEAEVRLLEAMVVASGARRVLEIGTFTGVTALSLAEVLPPDGTLVTLEFDEKVAEIARRHFVASPFSDRIDLRIGDARKIVRELDGLFDLVFIDAWKAHYAGYYRAVLPKLAPRGVIVADNVIWRGLPYQPDAHDHETEGVREFVRLVQDDPAVHNVLLTVGDGLMVIWKPPQ
jgi:caffeoyl-CoA O-methyltransferase